MKPKTPVDGRKDTQEFTVSEQQLDDLHRAWVRAKTARALTAKLAQTMADRIEAMAKEARELADEWKSLVSSEDL